ncbi:MAG: molecular chaperone [Anaerolineae bacterium]
MGPQDAAEIARCPELAETLPEADAASLAALAGEHQRLFELNLPPYESVFVDPAAEVGAVATARVRALHRQAEWEPPAGLREVAPDHLGLELLALADWWDAGRSELARRLQVHHLALWVPAFILSLRRLKPAPFYFVLGELTLKQIITTLPVDPIPRDSDPFPPIPPPPAPAEMEDGLGVGLRDIVIRLLVPRQTGLFLMRADIARLNRALDLPETAGERDQMLGTLFRLANERKQMPVLLEQLHQLLMETEAGYRAWAEEYPNWARYARVWYHHVLSTRTTLNLLGAVLIYDDV